MAILSLATPWRGELDLSFEQRHGRTQPQLHLARAPLRVQRPFYPDGQTRCYTTILHTAGGIVGGDELTLDLHLRPQSQVLVTTAAASKVYGSQGQTARQQVQIRIEAGADLEWLPQETIVFDGAIYRQELRIDLAQGASCLGWEITRFGRTARGEQFLSGEWRSLTEIYQTGWPLWVDPQWLRGSPELLASPHALAGQSVVATLFWVGDVLEDAAALVSPARVLWDAASPHQGMAAGVTCVQAGLICRYRGASSRLARQWFTQIWQLIRHQRRQEEVCLPRVWPI